MILTIWRHGRAEAGADDRRRKITDSGREELMVGSDRFGEACSARGIPHPELILHSPLVRTSQTAQIIAATFRHATVKAVSALQPEGDAAAVDDVVQSLRGDVLDNSHIILVSHQPLISNLVDYYLSDGGGIPFLTPGARVTLSLETHASSAGRLRFWALPPKYETNEQ